MKRKDFTIREDQIKKLEDRYKATGIRMSETVRQALDLLFKKEEKKDARTNKD